MKIVNSINTFISSTFRLIKFGYNWAEKTFDKNGWVLYFYFIGWGLIAGTIFLSLTQLLRLDPNEPLSGQRVLFYGSSIIYCWLWLLITQFWKRSKFWTPLIVNTGIVTGLSFFTLLLYSGHEIFYGPIIIFAISFLMLIFANSFYMMFTGQMELD